MLTNYHWMLKNKLYHFRSYKKKIDFKLKLLIKSVEIRQADSTKFLGIIIYQNEHGNIIIPILRGKCPEALKLFAKLEFSFKLDTLLTLYYSFIQQ